MQVFGIMSLCNFDNEKKVKYDNTVTLTRIKYRSRLSCLFIIEVERKVVFDGSG
jgi:hypothetical protein